MFDIGWSELLLIGIVALIVVGPKDLPKLFHALGQFTAKARSMARDFQRAMEQAAREAGAEDVANMAKDLRNMTSPKSLGLNALDAAGKRIDTWDQTKRGVSPSGPAEAGDKVAEVETGPATAELAAQVKANTAAAEARAAELAALRNKPTPEELAEAEHEPLVELGAKPVRRARSRTAQAADVASPAAGPAPKTARKPRAKKPAAGPSDMPADPVKAPQTGRAAKPNGADAAEVPAPKPPRKRPALRKTDA